MQAARSLFWILAGIEVGVAAIFLAMMKAAVACLTAAAVAG